MLKRADIKDFIKIKGLCSDSIVGIKIICQLSAYGFDRDFLEAWLLQSNDEPTAVILRFYDDALLVASGSADFEQLQTFLEMFCFNSVTCGEWICRRLGKDEYFSKNGYRFCGRAEIFNAEHLSEDDMFDAYSLISREIPGSFKDDREAYLSFLSDYTFRERRMLARGVCTHTDGKLSSVAVTAAETDSRALISGVACDSALKKRGLGKATVLSLVSELQGEGKSSFVIALNESAEGFYEHIGFEFIEKIALIERKK